VDLDPIVSEESKISGISWIVGVESGSGGNCGRSVCGWWWGGGGSGVIVARRLLFG